jgi:chromosomal replication initiator protein
MTSEDKNSIWKKCLKSIKVSVSPAIYSTWFVQTHLSSLKSVDKRYVAEIGCNSSFVKSTIESRYFGLIQDVLSKVLGKPTDIIFTIKQVPNSSFKESTDSSPLFSSQKIDKKQFSEKLARSRIRPGFTFKNFAVSSSNQMAWAAAEAVKKNPGTAYNPMFIWGGVGVGKTHLMSAVGRSILKNKEGSSILCCTGEEFTNDIVEGIRNKSTKLFRDKYRKLSALLIDDIQFIAGKVAVQEEFFHTFNALVANGSQVIMTSDRPPSEISKLEERLRSRFEAGLIVDIAPPDFELRCAIILIKSQERGLELDMDYVQLIAGSVDSARKIEGFLTRLMSEAKLKNKTIDKGLIENLFGKTSENNGHITKSNPNDLVNAVSKYFSLGKRKLLGSSRSRPVARPRQILMYLLRTELSLPLQEVGRIVGGRDHTTVMHAVGKITTMASEDINIRQDIRGIKNML